MCDLEIILCTEAGPLENMSMLLISSIRLLGGEFENVPIYSYQPRLNKGISNSTRDFFEKNGVTLIDEPLNTLYTEYPLANKPLACAHREEYSNADYLLFLDNDTFFCGFPHLLVDGLKNGADVALGPVDFNNVGTDMLFSAGEGAYWKSLYRLLRAKPRKNITTRIHKEKILEYYNSGFIYVKREVGLFKKWLENFNRVMDKGLEPSKGLFFVEQSCLSATVAQINLGVHELDRSYNYPVSAMSRRWKGYYPFTLRNVKHTHYHKLFRNSGGLNPIEKKLRKTVNGEQLNKLINHYLLSS